MDVYKLHHQNAYFKQVLSRQLEELKDSKRVRRKLSISYHDLVVLDWCAKHILKDDKKNGITYM